MKLLSAKISLTIALLAVLCSCESLDSHVDHEIQEWYQNQTIRAIRITYNGATSQSSYTPQAQRRPAVEIYGEPATGDAAKYHQLLRSNCSWYCRYTTSKDWNNHVGSPSGHYSAQADLQWRIIQDILLRLSALGYDGKIEFLIKSGDVWQTLSASGSIPFSEMSEFTRAEVYEQQLNDYVSKFLESN